MKNKEVDLLQIEGWSETKKQESLKWQVYRVDRETGRETPRYKKDEFPYDQKTEARLRAKFLNNKALDMEQPYEFKLRLLPIDGRAMNGGARPNAVRLGAPHKPAEKKNTDRYYVALNSVMAELWLGYLKANPETPEAELAQKTVEAGLAYGLENGFATPPVVTEKAKAKKVKSVSFHTKPPTEAAIKKAPVIGGLNKQLRAVYLLYNGLLAKGLSGGDRV